MDDKCIYAERCTREYNMRGPVCSKASMDKCIFVKDIKKQIAMEEFENSLEKSYAEEANSLGTCILAEQCITAFGRYSGPICSSDSTKDCSLARKIKEEINSIEEFFAAKDLYEEKHRFDLVEDENKMNTKIVDKVIPAGVSCFYEGRECRVLNCKRLECLDKDFVCLVAAQIDKDLAGESKKSEAPKDKKLERYTFAIPITVEAFDEEDALEQISEILYSEEDSTTGNFTVSEVALMIRKAKRV